MSVRTDIRKVLGDNCPCQAAQGDIPRFTFLPKTLYSTEKVAFVKLTARNDEGQLDGPEEQLLPVVGPLAKRTTSTLDICPRIPSIIILGLVRSREQRLKGHLCS